MWCWNFKVVVLGDLHDALLWESDGLSLIGSDCKYSVVMHVNNPGKQYILSKYTAELSLLCEVLLHFNNFLFSLKKMCHCLMYLPRNGTDSVVILNRCS